MRPRAVLLLAASFLLVAVEAGNPAEISNSTVLDICADGTCYYNPYAPGNINVQPAVALVPTVCANLVGGNGQYAYLYGEGRTNCFQIQDGDAAWKYDFVITRNKKGGLVDQLDERSCEDAMRKILNGEIGNCGDSTITASEIIGGSQQVGLFKVKVIPNPGLCGLPLSI